jgi:hypothetical protein
MTEAIAIDWCRLAQIAELQGFLDRHWQRGHVLARDTELLRWQHRVREDPERLAVLLARQSGELVGALGLILVPFCLRGARTAGAWLTTWVATPQARRQQAGLRLVRRALQEPLGFIGTVGANDDALRMYELLGFRTDRDIARWVRVVRSEALAELPARIAAPPAANPGPPPAAPRSVQVREWSEPLAGRWDELWHERLATHMTGTWRDSEYLRWRYLEHPRFAYALRAAEDERGRLRGLSVHRIVAIAGSQTKVLRLLELLGEEEAMVALTADALAVGKRAGVAFADLYCTSPGVSRALLACGFSRDGELASALPARFEPLVAGDTRLTGAFLARDGVDALRDGALYVTSSDADQDRPNRPQPAQSQSI